MPKTLLTYIFLCISSLALAQDKVIYDANVEKRNTGHFTGIRISDGIDLYISQAAEDEVAVSAAEVQHRDRIKTVVENNVLKIYCDEQFMGWNWHGRKLRAYVSVKELKEVRASGGSDVYIQGVLKTPQLAIRLSGGSDFKGDVAVNDITIDQSGGSDAHIKGTAVNVKVEASGGSDFKGYDLQAEYAIITASGGSDAELSVNKEIAAEASGGSDVHYKGNPVVKYSSSSGGGSVSKRG